MLGSRTLISLSQFLGLQQPEDTALILQKCGVQTPWSGVRGINDILNCLRGSRAAQVYEVIDVICRSTRTLRAAITPKYLYEERWTDLVRCLLLDGYHVTVDSSGGYTIVTIDPTISGVIPLDDDLSAELRRSSLADRDEIILDEKFGRRFLQAAAGF